MLPARGRGTHGWAEIDEARKAAIIEAIERGGATAGPSHLELDLTDRCNVACYFCNQQDVRTTDQLPLEHVRALIDELAVTGLKSVRLSGGGDPLAHREVGSVLDHLALRGVVVDNLTTNAALMGPEIARRLVDNGAREVLVSLNAASRDDYARMMQARPAVFDRVVENVRALVALRGDAAMPSIAVQFLLDRRNLGDLPAMYELGRAMQVDRIPISIVLNIPNQRIDPAILMHPDDIETLRPGLQAILAADREDQRLQIHFPVPAWNEMVAAIKRDLDYPPEQNLFPTAASFAAENGHCFFGWYTATVRGNGDLYPCCLLMSPDYPPLGRANEGGFAKHWNGPGFTRLRQEMRGVLLDGKDAKFDPADHKILRPQCVTEGACWLKNMYFRADEDFYRRLGEALTRTRRRTRLSRKLRKLVRGQSRV
jgi:MoaA/NifB/PqqE/SkfB family radical SAM enzyme